MAELIRFIDGNVIREARINSTSVPVRVDLMVGVIDQAVLPSSRA